MKIRFIGFFMAFCTLLFFAKSVHAQQGIDIQSDNTWKTNKFEEPWWHSITFNDSNWAFATTPSNGVCDAFSLPEPHIAAPMWAPTPMVGDSVYFRKKFTLDKKPGKAILRTVFDDDGDIYINSSLIRRDRSGSVNTEAFEDDISELLQEGPNVIGLYVIDTKGGCQSAQTRVDLALEFEDRILDIPLLKQDDDRWKNEIYAGGLKDRLGCGKTIGSCGCATTSTAMILKYLGALKSPNGQETSPQTLNEYFKKDQKCTSGGCVSVGYAFGAVRWAAVNQYSAEAFKKYGTQKIEWVDRTTPTIDGIKTEVRADNPVVLQSPDKKHWFVGYGISQNNVLIRDPLFERLGLHDNFYQNKAAAMVRFKKTNSDFRLIQVVSAPGQHIIVKDPLGRRVGYDSKMGKEINEIQHATYHFEELVDASQISSDINQAGVWTVTIKLPESGEYKVDVDTSQGNSKYAVAMYGADKEGNLMFDLNDGAIKKEGTPEVVFKYNNTILEPSKDLLSVQNKPTKKKKLCKKFPHQRCGKKVKVIKS